MTLKHFDVLIIGAGLSGIDAAHHLQKFCPNKSYVILEQRDQIGGTWDLFRYPGIRSDSDMFTMGFSFRPWTNPKAIAPGDDICDYVTATAPSQIQCSRKRSTASRFIGLASRMQTRIMLYLFSPSPILRQ